MPVPSSSSEEQNQICIVLKFGLGDLIMRGINNGVRNKMRLHMKCEKRARREQEQQEISIIFTFIGIVQKCSTSQS